jgi:hypothetical protein
LIVIDQFSSFPHIFECGKHATTKQVTDFITLFITTYSAPVIIYSDGGPQFKDEFDDFYKKWSINHIKSSPHYPQSNGVAESAVKEMKKIICAVFDNRTRTLNKPGLAAALLMFRNTPRSPTDLSPAQLVFGRHLRDFSRQMLRPQNRYEIEKRRLEINDGQRHKNYLSTRRKLSLLRPGQRVRFQDPITKKWTLTEKVTGFGETDRDYWVKDDEKARRYRRNRRFIKPIDVEATSPPMQPVQAPAPAGTESGKGSRTFADVASQPATPERNTNPTEERDVRFEAKSRREDSKEGRSIQSWRRKTENRESRSSEERFEKIETPQERKKRHFEKEQVLKDILK